MTMNAPHAQALPQAEINWDRLDKTKFFWTGAGLFSGVSAFLYPITVIKTRSQVVTSDSAYKTAPAIVKHIVQTDGIRGFYRGFGTVLTGLIPSRVIFMTALETSKAKTLDVIKDFDLPEATQAAVANGVAGLVSSIASQIIFVPLDVVSQRLMVQGTPGSRKYSGGLDALRKILAADGIRGLYRGFGMSVLTYSPNSAVWWAAYGSSQRLIWRHTSHDPEDIFEQELQAGSPSVSIMVEGTARHLGYADDNSKGSPSLGQVVAVQATGGIIAGAVGSIVTTPMDTVKTRLQVMEHEGEGRPSVAQTVKRLLEHDGWKGFYKGLGPRFVSMSLWGTSMIVTYEFLKRFSVKQEEEVTE